MLLSHTEGLALLSDWAAAIRVAALDCAEKSNHEVCQTYDIHFYPSFRVSTSCRAALLDLLSELGSPQAAPPSPACGALLWMRWECLLAEGPFLVPPWGWAHCCGGCVVRVGWSGLLLESGLGLRTSPPTCGPRELTPRALCSFLWVPAGPPATAPSLATLSTPLGPRQMCSRLPLGQRVNNWKAENHVQGVRVHTCTVTRLHTSESASPWEAHAEGASCPLPLALKLVPKRVLPHMFTSLSQAVPGPALRPIP